VIVCKVGNVSNKPGVLVQRAVLFLSRTRKIDIITLFSAYNLPYTYVAYTSIFSFLSSFNCSAFF
jgi:hypothetical protein